ncbi:hypothetical protein KC669_02210 [Candidatus Dojkabacteria bacterium]|uniref:Uncharacterized protein n=1 Tax=Candidatus Dojkabacteria bacterium TaxID=2099670 RepID=A0A955LAR4_9BACT|nr:hypothetical protein [Candidatus Dojkabacteria bacterium]
MENNWDTELFERGENGDGIRKNSDIPQSRIELSDGTIMEIIDEIESIHELFQENGFVQFDIDLLSDKDMSSREQILNYKSIKEKIALNPHNFTEMIQVPAVLSERFLYGCLERYLHEYGDQIDEAEIEYIKNMQNALEVNAFADRLEDFYLGLSALGLGYLTYGALLAGSLAFAAPILAYEAIPGLGGSPALWTCFFMTMTFGIPETIKIISGNSELKGIKGIASTWVRVFLSLNEVGFLMISILKNRDIGYHETRVMGKAFIKRLKPVSRIKNLIRGLRGKAIQPLYTRPFLVNSRINLPGNKGELDS